MNDDGDTKDDVKMPDGEVGEKINKLFRVDEKDTSKLFAIFSKKQEPKAVDFQTCLCSN